MAAKRARNWAGWSTWGVAACAAVVAGLLLAVGVVAGYFIHQSVAASKTAPAEAAAGLATGSMPALAGISSTPQQHGSDSWRAALLEPTATGAGTDAAASPRELPPLGSAAAQQLLSNPTTPGHIIKQYTWFSDNTIITGEKTAEFLRHLQAQLQATREQGSSSAVASAPAIDLAPFIRVALDVLRFLRAYNGEVLLHLLREFSASGHVALDDVSPDALQVEVNALLTTTEQLNAWYSVALVRDEAGDTNSKAHQEAAHTAAAAGRPQAAASGHRRLLALKRHRARHLHAAASIPAIPEDALDDGDSGPLPTASPSQTLQDMLCSVSSFSPMGVEGLALPPSGAKAGAKPAPVVCNDAPPTGYFQAGTVRFRPVVIPVVFHCLRFEADGVLQPPLFEAAALGQYLIDTTNRLYKGTGIQFKLEAVRLDPKAHPYLSVASLDDYQVCTANNKQARKYKFPCLTDVVGAMMATDPPSPFAINVLVSGSQDESAGLCGAWCPGLFLGYAKAFGPWQEENAVSATWAEDAPGENFVTLTWDMFAISGDTSIVDPMLTRDSGAVTLAHELGHYLGLRHTFAGDPDGCSGDGLAATDAVPDTPTNEDVTDAFRDRLSGLAGWCSDFKAGKAPPAVELLPYNSCGASDGHVDNVFNVMSYIPDACVMVFSPNQVARMQWATATFRPGLMAAHAV